MAGRRKKGIDDLDLAKLGTLIVFAVSFLYTKDLKAAGKLTFIVIISFAALSVLFVLIQRHRQTKALKPALRHTSSNDVGTSGQLEKVNDELDRMLHQPPPATSQKPQAWSLELIKSIDWKRFEELGAWYFQAKGRNAKVTELGADGGIDILLYGSDNSENILGVVQCKAWTNKLVGVKEIRELLGVMTDVGCPLGIFLTSSGYTIDAKAFASGKHIKLIDAKKLLELIRDLPADVQSGLLKRVTAGDYTTPSCPSCGIKLVARTARKGTRAGKSFWGCRNFPRCRYTMQRAK